MDKKTIIAAFLKQLGQEAGLGDLQLNPAGVLTLDIDGQSYGLHYLGSSEELYMISRLGNLPFDNKERMDMMAKLLELNCFFSATDKGVIGVPSEDSIIYYTAPVDVDHMEYADFKKAFFRIVDVCIKLRKDMVSDEKLVHSDMSVNFDTMLRV